MQSKLLSTPAIAVILVCFFLPWVTVSCSAYGNQVSEIELTGYELATGKEISRFGDRTEADAAVFLIPLAALAAAGWLFVGSRSAAGKGIIFSALTGLAVLGLKWMIMQENQTADVTVSAEHGLSGTLGGLVLLLIGGFVALNEEDNKSPPPPDTFE